MPIPVAMPRLGMTMREGTVVEWRVAPGERVEKGQILLVVESEKAEVEIEAPASGVLRHVYVEAGASAPAGALIAALSEEPAEAFDPEAFRREHGGTSAPRGQKREPAPSSRPLPGAGEGAAPRARSPITPAARRRARELGVDPARIVGSGPGGRVTREDVEAHAARLAGRVETPHGVALEARRAGDSGSQVLLIPGFGTDVTLFARILPALVPRHRTVALQPRGVGLSDAPEAELYAIEEGAADAAALLAKEGGHIVGASLGAAVALELALRAPERLRSLTLITPVVRASARLLAVLEAWCDLAAADPPERLARVLLPWLFSENFLADEQRRERARRAFAASAAEIDPASLTRWRAGLAAWSGSRESELGRLRVATLVIAAGQDLLVPDAGRIAKRIPGAELVEVGQAGHAVTLEAAEAVARALAAHLEKAEGGEER